MASLDASLCAERLLQGAVENLVHDGGLAGAGDAGDAAEHAEGDFEVDAAQVVDARAFQAQHFAAGFAAMSWDGDGDATGEILAGDGVGVGLDFGDGARGQQRAAELARAGAEVEQVVGGADDVGVVLDDEDGVAEVAEVVHDADELGGVARVQADGGLVQHVERADQARTERRGELNALRFAAARGGAEAVEGEVVEADLLQEADALAHLFEDLAGDLHLRGESVSASKNSLRAGDGEGATSQMFLP